MDPISCADDLHKIVVLNPKGGSGKTTLATNLASIYASRESPPTLVDCDPQGYSMRWLDKRPPDRPAVYGVAAYADRGDNRTIGTRIRPDTSVVIIDLPAAIPHAQLHVYTYFADSILIPIVPSEIDVYSASRLVAELLLDAQLDRRDRKLAIVANRVRTNTRSYQQLRLFLASLKIPMIAALRDTQNYVYASAHGIGICELPAYAVKNDIGQLNAVMAWLDKWQSRRLDEEIAREFETVAEADWPEAHEDSLD